MLAFVAFAAGFWLVSCAAKPSSTAPTSFVSPPGTPPETGQPSATVTDISMERATKQAFVKIELTDTHRRSTPLPPGVLKPTPTGLTSVTPEPTAFAPFPQRTPLGGGALAPMMPPFPSMQFRVINAWYTDLDGLRKRTVVYAGARPGSNSENGQGGVVVYVWQMSAKGNQTATELVEASSYFAPAQAKSLDIIDAVGERLVLHSVDGATFYFDVPTRQYVSSLMVTVTVPPSTVAPATPVASGTLIL